MQQLYGNILADAPCVCGLIHGQMVAGFFLGKSLEAKMAISDVQIMAIIQERFSQNRLIKLIDKIFYSLGRTTIPTSIVNIIVVGTYLNVGGGLPLDHRIKRIGPVNRIGKL
jgi:hypothetical protein